MKTLKNVVLYTVPLQLILSFAWRKKKNFYFGSAVLRKCAIAFSGEKEQGLYII